MEDPEPSPGGDKSYVSQDWIGRKDKRRGRGHGPSRGHGRVRPRGDLEGQEALPSEKEEALGAGPRWPAEILHCGSGLGCGPLQGSLHGR